MMPEPNRVPAGDVSQSSTQCEDEQADARVQYLDGQSLLGSVRRWDADGRRLWLHTDGDLREVLLSDVRYVAQPATDIDQGTGLHAIEVTHHQGEVTHITASRIRVEAAGLWALGAVFDEGVNDACIPWASVAHYQIGPINTDPSDDLNAADATSADVSVAAEDIRPTNPTVHPRSLQELRERLERDAHAPLDPATLHEALGSYLLQRGLITQQQLDAALDEQRQHPKRRLGAILIRQGVIGEDVVAQFLARKLGLIFVRLNTIAPEEKVIDLVSADWARKHGIMPLFMARDHLVAALADPTDTDAVNALRFTTGRPVEIVVTTRDDINRAITRHYGGRDEEAAVQSLDLAAPRHHGDPEADELERLGREKPVVRLINNILRDAIRQRASDIHLRPTREAVELWYRIDGTLVQMHSYTKALLPALIGRIKILGRMDIAEHRLPQDGRSQVVHDTNVVDLRISVIPTVEGESAVIRILNTREGLKDIASLGFSTRDRELVTDLLHKSYGMLLVTGPTGSGKSTTLYAALNDIRQQNVNMITVEDPVEYHLAGVEQIQVNAATGFTFARALRHILRHDPDVIMIGEMRDEETARIAVESALTGHLVLSTLHTNDAASTVTRLLDIGIEPYLINSALLGILAQRLVRRNCRHCMVEEHINPHIRRVLGVGEGEVFYQGRGCEHCHGTGYSGRVAVYELLALGPPLRQLIAEAASAERLREQALADGMIPLTENALARAREGVTSLAEVYRVRLS